MTAEDVRGSGYARSPRDAVDAGRTARRATAYLQVSADNTPALAIYRKFGFATIYTYHYRGRTEDIR